MATASPATLEEASALLATASAEGRRVHIGRELTTDRLDRLLEHSTGDLTCIVEAGIRISHLQAALERHGQRLALDPPGDPTIGACLAANLSGPLRHRYGSPRDLVLGATLVLGDGTVASSGGRVVKNVAGYDLAKLVCGSRGTLALIARVALRLHPLPAASATVVVDDRDTVGVTRTLLRSQLQPSALDLLHPGRVAVLLEGSEAAVAAQAEAVQALVGGAETPGVWEESRARQAAAAGRRRFVPGELGSLLEAITEGVVRPSAGVAYVPGGVDGDLTEGVRRLNRALKARFDPAGTLV